MNAMTGAHPVSAGPGLGGSAAHPTAQTFAVSDLERMAKAVAKSGLFGMKTADQALALMLLAQAEGRHPVTAARDYDIIDGRPAKKAEAMLRDFLAAGGAVEWLELTDQVCRARFSHPCGGSATIEWTNRRAATAGIINSMWERYPRQMLRCRVVSEGVRTVCPMATSGMYVNEEVRSVAWPPPSPVPLQSADPLALADDQEPPASPDEPRPSGPAPSNSESAPHGKSARQLKAEGEDARIQAEINECDLAGLEQWEQEFTGRTGHLPRSWLDPIRDMIILRREEVQFAAASAEMDAEYAARAT